MHNHKIDYNLGRHGAIVGIIVNILLFIFKAFAGVIGRSHAMMADALHTATDFLTSIGVFIGFKIAQKPADVDHPYGHGRAESIMSKLVSLILILGGIKVAFDSVKIILLQKISIPYTIALWAALISIVVKEMLYRYIYHLGLKIQSNSLKADAWHHRSDALSSVAALVGIAGSRLGLSLLDPLAALVVSIFVVKAGLRLFYTAYRELMDAALPPKVLDEIKRLSLEVEGVKRIKDIKGRKMGIEIFIDIVLEVDKDITVEQGHTITAKVRRNILKNLKGAKDIFIHVEPYQCEKSGS